MNESIVVSCDKSGARHARELMYFLGLDEQAAMKDVISRDTSPALGARQALSCC